MTVSAYQRHHESVVQSRLTVACSSFPTASISQAIVNGNYTIPVPPGNYSVGVEAVDGSPNAAVRRSASQPRLETSTVSKTSSRSFTTTTVKARLNASRMQDKNVHVNAGQVNAGTNIITNNVITVSPFGARTNIGFINPPAGGFIYAVAFSGFANQRSQRRESRHCFRRDCSTVTWLMHPLR